jgi:hypothetical protein
MTMDRPMRALARAFAVVALAVASDLHYRGVDLDGIEQQHILDRANRAMFEHLVDIGVAVDTVRSASGTSWCGIIRVAGELVTMHDIAPVGARRAKRRPVTCAACRAALGVA